MAWFLNYMRFQLTPRTSSQEDINLERGRDIIPMSGTNEALWFAPGGDYALPDDDFWDPFKEDPAETTDTLPTEPHRVADSLIAQFDEPMHIQSDSAAGDEDDDDDTSNAQSLRPRHQRKGKLEIKSDLSADDVTRLASLSRNLPVKKENLLKLETKHEKLHNQIQQINTTKSQKDASTAETKDQEGESKEDEEENEGTPLMNREQIKEPSAKTLDQSPEHDVSSPVRAVIQNLIMPHPVSAVDKMDIEITISEVAEELLPLRQEVKDDEKIYEELLEKVKNNPKVKRARKSYKRERPKFIRRIFTSIQHGKLDDVATLTAALDMEGAMDLIKLDNISQPKSNYYVIHLALLKDRQEVVEFLLKHSGKTLAKVAVETEECDHLTPLYIAIQHGNLSSIKLILNSVPEEDNERADYINELVPNTAYKGLPYDELPLAASVWSSVAKEMNDIKALLDYLVDNGADLAQQTSAGNTLLHLFVLQAVETTTSSSWLQKFLKQTFSKAVGAWWRRRRNAKRKNSQKYLHMSSRDDEVLGLKYLMGIENNDGLNPLALAAMEESPLYIDLINWENVMRYPDPKMGQQFSNIDTYNITCVTSMSYAVGKRYKYNTSSVMHVLAHNSVDLSQKVWGVDISCEEPLKSIIQKKWSIYQWVFYIWGFIHLFNMSAFTYATFHYHPDNLGQETHTPIAPRVQANSSTNQSLPDIDSLGSGYYGPVLPGLPYFAVFMILPVVYFICELVELCSTVGNFKLHYSITGNGLYRVICIAFSIFTTIWFLLHMQQNVNQDIILSIALLFGWLFGIFFTRTIKFPSRTSQIGAFSIMVQRMLFHDLLPFLMISCFVLMAFSAAIHATLLHSKEAAEDELKFRNTFYEMLKYYSALDDGQGAESSREKQFAKAVLSVYGIISVVLLINMLIAAMNKTYELVSATHTDLVQRQRLAILLMLERRLPFQCLRELSERDYTCNENRRTDKFDRFYRIISKKVEFAQLIKKKRGPARPCANKV